MHKCKENCTTNILQAFECSALNWLEPLSCSEDNIPQSSSDMDIYTQVKIKQKCKEFGWSGIQVGLKPYYIHANYWLICKHSNSVIKLTP